MTQNPFPGEMPDLSGIDMGGLLAQAQAMQQQLANAEAELETKTFTGSAGGDLVEATVNGAGELLSVIFKPEACDPEDTESMGDLVVAAVHAAQHQRNVAAQTTLSPFTQMASQLSDGLGGFVF